MEEAAEGVVVRPAAASRSARRQPAGWPAALRELRSLGLLRDLDVCLLEALGRTHGVPPDADPAGALLLALACRALGEGHVCLDLDALSAGWIAALRREPEAEGEPPAELEDWCRRIAAAARRRHLPAAWAPLAGRPEEGRPFVLAGRRLYLRRMFNYEANVARRLRAMAGEPPTPLPPEAAAAIAALPADDDQRRAARLALTRRLAVITGGPGSGKTHVAARILALLPRLPLPPETPPLVRLAAPTGKAAARLGESLRQAREEAGAAWDARLRIEPACTLERLLGFRGDAPRFRHDAANPLTAAMIVVDEAGMIDLARMSKLLDAVGPQTRLLLLGDRHQLAAVQPGGVLADICEAPLLRPCLAELTRSRRFPPESPLARLGAAIVATATEEDADAAWRIAVAADPAAIAVHAPDRDLRSPDFAAAVREGYGPLLAARTPAEAFRALDGFRVLCALRRGPCGVARLNALIEDILAAAAAHPLRPDREFYSRRVVMVTRNDYATRLFNGDVGVVLPVDPARPEGAQAVYFPAETTDAAGGGPWRRLPCGLLPEHETALATTIHKAQGAEFERVLVLLPEDDSPLLARELVYTAVTRARRRLDLWCARETFRRAVLRRARRFTGLRELLAGGPPAADG